MKKFIRDYRNELCIELVILCILFILWMLGIINFRSVFSDGTFITGILSIPIFISQYISSKKNEKRRFYYSDLDKIADFSTSANSREENAIKVKVLQLENIYHSGISKIDGSEDKKRFVEIVKSVYFNLITQGIDIEQYLRKENIEKIDLDSIEDFEKKDSKWLKELMNEDTKGNDTLEKWFHKNIKEVEPLLYWKGEKRLSSEIVKKKGYQNLVFYKTKFNIPSEKEVLNGISNIFSSCALVDSDFIFNNKDDEKTVLQNLRSNDEDMDVVMINVKSKCSNSNEELKPLAIEKMPQIDVEVKLGDKEDEAKIEDDKLLEIKRKYLEKNTLVKTSKRYADESQPHVLKSWFSMTFKAYESFKNTKNSIKFIVFNNDCNPNFPPYIVLTFNKESFKRLVDYKQSNKSQLKRYDFYFWITFDEKMRVVKVEDDRDQSTPIYLNIRK